MRQIATDNVDCTHFLHHALHHRLSDAASHDFQVKEEYAVIDKTKAAAYRVLFIGSLLFWAVLISVLVAAAW